jgi:hypothetical protein
MYFMQDGIHRWIQEEARRKGVSASLLISTWALEKKSEAEKKEEARNE